MAFDIEILYEDEYIIAVDKPAGLPMHPNLDPQRENLVSVLEAELRARGEGLLKLGIHQRLDLGTSGAVVFSKSREANPSLARQFAEHSARKIYAALTDAVRLKQKNWECAFSLAEPLKRGGPVRWLKGAESDEIKGKTAFKNALTQFALLKRGRGALLLQAELKSGRKHQIRAHLAAQKTPILGDELYRGSLRAERDGRIFVFGRPMLHARYLQIVHPIDGRLMEFKAPWPEDFRKACQFFEIELEELDVQT
ncbi:RluA family pseudouridine synthase [bacterium]|nr:RluA family pseudouridine synthase [bacterium]